MRAGGQVDLGDMENEVRTAEDAAKKAVADAQRLSEELRRQQDVASSSEKQRRTFETQARIVAALCARIDCLRREGYPSVSVCLPVRLTVSGITQNRGQTFTQILRKVRPRQKKQLLI